MAAPTSTISFSSSISSARPFALPRVGPAAASVRYRTPAVRAKIREIFMPALSSTMTEGKIVSWIKTEGDKLSKGESVVVVESDKADMDVETFYDGILAAVIVPEGESAPVGSPIALLAESEEEIALAKSQAQSKSSQSSPPPAQAPAASAPEPAPLPVSAPAPADGPNKTVATPYAKKLAKQHKVDIASVAGTGQYGRITAEDVEKAAGIQPKKQPVPAAAPVAAASSAPASAALPPIPGSTIVPFTTMQSAVSKNMVESLSVPTFRVGYPVTTDALDALYERV